MERGPRIYCDDPGLNATLMGTSGYAKIRQLPVFALHEVLIRRIHQSHLQQKVDEMGIQSCQDRLCLVYLGVLVQLVAAPDLVILLESGWTDLDLHPI